MHSYDGTVTTTASLEHVIGSSRKRIRSTAGGGILSSRLHRHQAVNVFNDDDDVSGLLTNLSSSAFNPKAPADGDAAIGRIMLALTRNNNRNGVNNCDEVGFRRAMKSARDAVLAPLAAAAMEGSWQRAHRVWCGFICCRSAQLALKLSSLSAKRRVECKLNLLDTTKSPLLVRVTLITHREVD